MADGRRSHLNHPHPRDAPLNGRFGCAMSMALLRLPALAIVVVAALAHTIALLPLLLGLFAFTVGTEMLVAHLTKRWLVDELESLRRANDADAEQTVAPPVSLLGSLLWQAVADKVWAVADWLVVGPVIRGREQRGFYDHQGRHHADRWARHEIAGTVAQRRHSAAAQQRLVADIIKADTGENPVIDDTAIQVWLQQTVEYQGTT